MHPRLAGAFLMAMVFSDAAKAEPDWKVVETQPFVVKVRKRPDRNIYEVWSEGVLQAPVKAIQDAVTDMDHLRDFMPYMTESRELAREADGAQLVYARLDLPVLSPRDFVHRSYMDRDSGADPEGIFQNHWYAEPNRAPRRPGVVRLEISEGSWLVKPLPDGRSFVSYHFTADPGGWIPAFAVNRSNASSVIDTFRRVEREAQRRLQATPKQAATASATSGRSP
jgi:hypothetical protein